MPPLLHRAAIITTVPISVTGQRYAGSASIFQRDESRHNTSAALANCDFHSTNELDAFSRCDTLRECKAVAPC